MSPSRRDAAVTAITLALLVAWDASSMDLAAAQLFGNSTGFAGRDSWWAATMLHDGGRVLAWLLLAAQVLMTLRVSPNTPTRAARWGWIGVTLLCALTVPALKRLSTTSCPWDMALFGGVAQHLSHWRWGVADGGAGHCFPSGHAVSAFAFFGIYLMWRPVNPQRARLWLAGVLIIGTLFGTAQLARGAHFPSHTMWSAWICWTLCSGMAALQRQYSHRRSHHGKVNVVVAKAPT